MQDATEEEVDWLQRVTHGKRPFAVCQTSRIDAQIPPHELCEYCVAGAWHGVDGRNGVSCGDFLHGVAALRHLADGFVLELGRVSLLADRTPLAASILASGVSSVPG